MLSEKANKTVKACRFCWMCRHLCPIGLKTGRENNTPRAKGILLDMAGHGEAYSVSMAEDMYQCLLCGACAAGCETGFDPRIFIREARTKAVVEDVVPDYVQAVIDNLTETGNLWGIPSEKKAEALSPWSKDKAEVILYAGETAALKTPQMVETAAKLLAAAGVDFATLRDEPSSGAMLGDLIGYVDDTAACAKILAEAIASAGAKTVVVLDPADANVMKQEYPQWGIELGADVVTATAYFAELAAQGRLNPAKVTVADATYHDPDRLARDLDETQPARDLLAAMGIAWKEMFFNRDMVRSCGEQAVKAHSPKIVALTAAGRWEDVDRCGRKTVITASPSDYEILSADIPKGHAVEDLFALLAKACGL